MDGATPDKLAAFKVLAVRAAMQVAAGRPGFGMLLDDKYGRDALFAAGTTKDFWIAKPIELPGSRPLKFEFSQDLGSRLVEWPVDHCIKVLCFYHPDDDAALKAEQIEKLTAAHDAARKIGREILIEIIASKAGPVDDRTTARALGQLYAAGLKPEWWKLESQPSAAAWLAIDDVIETADPYCRGVVLLGLDAPADDLKAAFKIAKGSRTVKGFAVGRTIFGDAARGWLVASIDDGTAVAMMSDRFAALCDAWDGA